MRIKKWVKWGVILGLSACVILLYVLFNPGENAWFPKCPFRLATGLECPGCGSQRAVHHLLRGNIPGAMGENVLLVLAIPYLIVGFIFDTVKNPGDGMVKWRRRLFGIKAVWTVLVVVILFWILRNLPLFSEYL